MKAKIAEKLIKLAYIEQVLLGRRFSFSLFLIAEKYRFTAMRNEKNRIPELGLIFKITARNMNRNPPAQID